MGMENNVKGTEHDWTGDGKECERHKRRGWGWKPRVLAWQAGIMYYIPN